VLLLLCVVFGLPALAAMLAGQIGWNSRLVGWLTLVLVAVLAWLGFRAERKGWLGAGLRDLRRLIFPNSELRRKGSDGSRKRD
jgi:hypothetical protein